MWRRPGWIWGGRIAAVAVLAGLAAYLASAGLDKANQLASVLSLLVAVAALGAPYLLPSSDGRESNSGPAQQVTNTAVGGHLTQVRNAKRVRAEASVDSVPHGKGGQYVNGVWVGGHLTQVDGADIDVTTG